MLELFAKHGAFDLTLHAQGDLDVDQHHTVEDAASCSDSSSLKRLGDRVGIQPRRLLRRADGEALPWSRSISVGALPVYRDKVKTRLVGDLQSELLEDFFRAS